MEYDLHSYQEEKPYRLRRNIWYFLNIIFFPLLSNRWRIGLLRFMGADIGKLCRIYRSVRIYAPWNLVLGNKVCIGPFVNVYNKGQVKVGSNVIISQNTYICTASHDISSPVMRLVVHPIDIGSKVWIAAKATILPGVVVGDGCVVGACAVVSKNAPQWSVVVGNPARVVGERELHD